MRGSNKDLDFLHEVAKMISERSKEDSPISPDEVLDLFHDTFEKMTDIRTIEVPIFMPVMNFPLQISRRLSDTVSQSRFVR